MRMVEEGTDSLANEQGTCLAVQGSDAAPLLKMQSCLSSRLLYGLSSPMMLTIQSQFAPGHALNSSSIQIPRRPLSWRGGGSGAGSQWRFSSLIKWDGRSASDYLQLTYLVAHPRGQGHGKAAITQPAKASTEARTILAVYTGSWKPMPFFQRKLL